MSFDWCPPDLDPDLLQLVVGAEPREPAGPGRRVFVNRSLRLDQISHVGFDLDYTLAEYRKEPFELLQFHMTRQRLIEQRHYPEAIAKIPYEPRRVMRGLVVDRRRGNLLKMNTHDHVGRAAHGGQMLPRERRHELYRNRRIRLSAQRFASLDTLFSIPEGALYSALIDFFDARHAAGQDLQPVERQGGGVAYEKIFADVRETIDGLHADGSLKSVVMQDIARYIQRDPALAMTLHKLRSTGKKLYVITNSGWTYSQALLSYLLDGASDEYPSWRSYFDLVVVSAGKPGFFTQREPFLVLGDDGAARGVLSEGGFDRNTIYAHGNIRDFERKARAWGDQVLYVGDHIYGDILRSKKESLWRTALIIPEVEDEVERIEEDRQAYAELEHMDNERRALDDDINDLASLVPRFEAAVASSRASSGKALGALELRAVDQALQQLRASIDQRKRSLREVSQSTRERHAQLDFRFNPMWGRVFKERNELSRFGSQVEDYACIYTSRVTNLVYYSPLHYFRAPLDRMAHEPDLD